MSLLHKRAELFAPVPETERQVFVTVHASHFYAVNLHEIYIFPLFATTQATEKRQNIAAKLKLFKKRKVTREKCNKRETRKDGRT
jgi:hypothetical protein